MADPTKALREVQKNRVVGNWELTEPLSRGGQGVTWRAIWKSDKQSAVTAVMVGSEIHKSVVKLMIPPSPTDLPVPAARYAQVLEHIADEFFNEFAILSHLDCPYIPKFYQADRQATKAGWKVPWCAIELVEGRSLADQRKKHGPIKEGPLLEVAHDVLTALDAIHTAGLVHLDLKPANVMLEPGRAILIDFGIAGQANAAQHGIAGTPGFFPPENLDDQLERKDFSPAVDLFKLGVTLASAAGIDPSDLWGLPPAAPNGHGQFGDAGLRHATRLAMRKGPNLDGLTTGLTQLVTTLLAFDPDRRGTARSILKQVESLQAAGPVAGVSTPKVAPTPASRKQAATPAAQSTGGKAANVGAKIEVVDQLGLNWTGVVVNLDPKKANHILVRHESVRGASNIRSYPVSKVVKGTPLK
jgi:serine/threonine protein kinase